VGEYDPRSVETQPLISRRPGNYSISFMDFSIF